MTTLAGLTSSILGNRFSRGPRTFAWPATSWGTGLGYPRSLKLISPSFSPVQPVSRSRSPRGQRHAATIAAVVSRGFCGESSRRLRSRHCWPSSPGCSRFHSLRHSHLTVLGRYEVDPEQLRNWMLFKSCSSSEMFASLALCPAIGRGKVTVTRQATIPRAPTRQPGRNAIFSFGHDAEESTDIPLRLTRTDGGKPATTGIKPDNVVRLGVPTGYVGPHQSASSGNLRIVGKESVESPQVFETQARTNSHQVAAIGESEGGGNRTHDQRIKSPATPRRKPKPHKTVTLSADSGCSVGCSSQRSEGGILDADLSALVAAWPTLPEHVRATIQTLVESCIRGADR